jgi:hypothetical protein
VTYLRTKPWRSRAPFAGRLVAARRRGSFDQDRWPLVEPSDAAKEQNEEPLSGLGTPLAFEQPDVVRISQGRIDESGLLAFHRRTLVSEHANLDGRLPPPTAGRRSA